MTSTPTQIAATLDGAAMKLLAACTGPCVTIQVPGHRPAAQEGARKTLFRDLLRSVKEQATAATLDHADDLIKPLEDLDGDGNAGGPPFAIFRSPEFLLRYRTPDIAFQAPVVGNHFYLTPFLPAAFAPGEFYILGLSSKRLRLLEYQHGDCRELELPKGVPESVEAAGAFDPPDHELANRTAAGVSVGNMRGVKFGTNSDREAADEYLHNFFTIVDRELKPRLAGKPLLLAGVHEEVNAYRRAAKYTFVLGSEITGNVEYLSLGEIATRAADAALMHYYGLGERVFAEYREMKDRGRALNDLREILRAATQGRVHQLCVRAQTKVPDANGEDLLNAAAVETLKHGGEVYAVPAVAMPITQAVAAILRF